MSHLGILGTLEPSRWMEEREEQEAGNLPLERRLYILLLPDNLLSRRSSHFPAAKEIK